MLFYTIGMRAACVCLIVAITAAPAWAQPVAAPKTDAERLQGVWLFEAAMAGKTNRLPIVWTSKLTVTGDSFELPNFAAKKDLKGRFTFNPAADPKAIDVKLEDFDLSSLGLPMKFPAAAMPGIFKLEGDRLTICFNAETAGKRPNQFDIADDMMVRLTLVKAPLGFKEFPQEFTVKVSGPDGKPAVGATLCQRMIWREDIEKKDANPEWQLYQAVKVGSDGAAKLKFKEIRNTILVARDAENKLIGTATIASPVSLLKSDMNIRLQPECKVVGAVKCDQLKKLDKPLGWTDYDLAQDGNGVADYSSKQGNFEFFLPSGTYKLRIRGENTKRTTVTFTVSPGQRELTVGPFSLIATNLVLLQGQPAPELAGVVGWKGNQTKLAELKGKYVLLEFWGFWCGPCVQSMPILLELHEKFGDKGLAIVGVHLDIEGEIDTAAKLDEKIAFFKKGRWKGKDLPFPVALTSGKRFGEETSGGAAEQYGVRGYPTTILIDREGKVVGEFNARDAKTACAEIEKLLDAKK